MIKIKTAEEIFHMREGGRIAAEVLNRLLRKIEPGVNTLNIDRLAGEMIRGHGAKASFKGFEGYRFSTCINVNEGVVHGVPKKTVIIKKGDIVKVDLGILYKGFHTDVASSLLIPEGKESDKPKYNFLKVGREALLSAIKACRVGNRIGDISSGIQKIIEDSGFSVVEELVGHGVGRLLHEDPQIPGKGMSHTGPLLKEGMVLAIEVIYTQEGGRSLSLSDDGWTLSVDSGKMAGLFEHTVALSPQGVEILT